MYMYSLTCPILQLCFNCHNLVISCLSEFEVYNIYIKIFYITVVFQLSQPVHKLSKFEVYNIYIKIFYITVVFQLSQPVHKLSSV